MINPETEISPEIIQKRMLIKNVLGIFPMKNLDDMINGQLSKDFAIGVEISQEGKSVTQVTRVVHNGASIYVLENKLISIYDKYFFELAKERKTKGGIILDFVRFDETQDETHHVVIYSGNPQHTIMREVHKQAYHR